MRIISSVLKPITQIRPLYIYFFVGGGSNPNIEGIKRAKYSKLE